MHQVAKLSCALVLLPLTFSIASAQTHWPSLATQDLWFIHDYVTANHPGMVNQEDPDFGQRESRAFNQALSSISKVHDYAGYFWLLERYRSHFNDLHVQIFPSDTAPALKTRWPGFLTSISTDGIQRVVAREKGANIPLNASLLSCDDIDAKSLLQKNVGNFVPAWFLRSQQSSMGYRLFIDQGNPFIQRPGNCLFTFDGKTQRIKLNWHGISPTRIRKYISQTRTSFDQPIALRHLADDSWWLALPSFDSFDNNDKLQQSLTRVLKRLQAKLPAIRQSKGLTIDLRGNTGGNSVWGAKLTDILWGKNSAESLLSNEAVDWRTSAGVLQELQLRAQFKELPLPLRKPMQKVATAVHDAQQQGHSLWREQDTPSNTHHDVRPAGFPILVVTDESCVSACLDSLELFRSAGAIQVGSETSADTFYMDDNSLSKPETPSHLTRISIPMKIYRHRLRGSNEPFQPLLEYHGDITQTQDVETWVSLVRHVVTGLNRN